jgi:hypothetical protein
MDSNDVNAINMPGKSLCHIAWKLCSVLLDIFESMFCLNGLLKLMMSFPKGLNCFKICLELKFLAI